MSNVTTMRVGVQNFLFALLRFVEDLLLLMFVANLARKGYHLRSQNPKKGQVESEVGRILILLKSEGFKN